MTPANRSHPVPDSAEVSIDFPNKAYVGTFSRGSDFSIGLDADALHLKLERHGEEKRKVALHIHFGLAAGILDSLADAIEADPVIDAMHLAWLRRSATRLAATLEAAGEGPSG